MGSPELQIENVLNDTGMGALLVLLAISGGGSLLEASGCRERSVMFMSSRTEPENCLENAWI